MERNVTKTINGKLMQRACPGSHNHAPTPAETKRWDVGAILPDAKRPAIALINVLLTVRDALIERRRERRVYDDLMALDDCLLADIGMHRSQIPAIVKAMSMCQGAELRPAAAPARSPRALRLVSGHP